MNDRGKYDFDFQGKVILVVEDNAISFKLISAVLSKVNVRIVHAATGERAIELCKGEDLPDLILMDLQLPEVNGLDATRAIKKLRPEIPVIAATANTFDADREACLKAGCDAYISKPFKFRKLFELMQEFIDHAT